LRPQLHAPRVELDNIARRFLAQFLIASNARVRSSGRRRRLAAYISNNSLTVLQEQLAGLTRIRIVPLFEQGAFDQIDREAAQLRQRDRRLFEFLRARARRYRPP
jgi:hypothetical protein